MAVTFERQVTRGIMLGILIAPGASTEDLVPARGAGKKARIVGGELFTDAADDIQLTNLAGDPISAVQSPPAAGVWNLDDEQDRDYVSEVNEAIRVTRSATGFKGYVIIIEGPNP